MVCVPAEQSRVFGCTLVAASYLLQSQRGGLFSNLARPCLASFGSRSPLFKNRSCRYIALHRVFFSSTTICVLHGSSFLPQATQEKKRTRWGGDSDDSDGGPARSRGKRRAAKEAKDGTGGGGGQKVLGVVSVGGAGASKATTGGGGGAAAAAGGGTAGAAATAAKPGPSVAAAVVPKVVHTPLLDGCRSVECYTRLNHIDEGTYGVVFRAQDKETGEIFALKQVRGAACGRLGERGEGRACLLSKS
jgi:hypothetical protein